MSVPGASGLGVRATTRLVHGANYAVLTAGGLIMIFPLVWMVLTSLKALPETRAYPPIWLPSAFHFENYPDALTSQPFGLYFRNTAIITVLVVIGDVLSCSMVAYGFARLRFPLRDFWFVILLSTMMVPFIVRLVPLFVVFKTLGWINTYLPLVVPAFFGTPFFIFLVRQFFLTIPAELADAARIDGCSEPGIWWQIMLPLSKPALAVVAILAFQNAWNDFMGPLIYLNSNEMKTAILGLATMRSPSGLSTEMWNWLMAVATTMVAPMVVLFVAFQRAFVQGVVLSGIKG